jgi:hypothetical protein
MATDDSIQLTFSDGRSPLTSVVAINEALASVGSQVWPLVLRGTPTDIQRLLTQSTLTEVEVERIKAHFLLPRQRLLEIIASAGRTPHVPGGGELTTGVSTHGYSYPQLWVVQGGVDYSRFDRFHVNVTDDGIGVDEVLQMLSGGGVVIHQRQPDGAVLTLCLKCPAEDTGWLLTYDGGSPHIGSLSGATPGTKVLAQVIGPARWGIRYMDTECESGR